jgi:hypothetical protein
VLATSSALLARVSRRVLADHGRGAHERGGAIRVDRRHAEGRVEPARGAYRDAVEGDKVRGANQDRHVEGAPRQQPVRMRGHRARVHQAGMRRNERHQIAGHVARGPGQMGVNRSRQRGRSPRIPRARDRRRSNPSNLSHPSNLGTLEPGTLELWNSGTFETPC